ncbi:MAG: ATP synthase F1 subunit epsilon [Butyrivibrio sp.]|nr:ATP synthase F1 subunit epsilon [Butyrivibrio sp.]
MATLFRLQVMSINGVFFDGRVNAVIIPAIDGDREIMAHHEEMVIAVYNGEMRIQTEDGNWRRAVVGIGSAQVANNRVTILVDTCERPEDIDLRRAQEALEDAKEKMRQKKSIREYKMSQAAMARALSRIKSASRYDHM